MIPVPLFVPFLLLSPALGSPAPASAQTSGRPGEILGKSFHFHLSTWEVVDDLNGDGHADLVFLDTLSGTWGVDARHGVFAKDGESGEILWFHLSDPYLAPFTTLCSVGDLDGDGAPEILAGRPWAVHPEGTAGAGEVRVLSGSSGTLIRSHWGEQTREDLGRTLAPCGDADGDGVKDYLIGAPGVGKQERPWDPVVGAASLFSGATGQRLAYVRGTFPNPGTNWVNFAGSGDFDGDGLADFVAVVGPSWLTAYSGQDGHPIRSFPSTSGRAACIETPGLARPPNLVVGEPYDSGHGIPSAGRVLILDGATASILHEIPGEQAYGRFGSRVAAASDLDRDGYEDWATSSLDLVGPSYTHIGEAETRSGKDGSTIARIDGKPDASIGHVLAAGRDWDGDGTADLFLGIDAGYGNPDILRICSGLTGGPVAMVYEQEAGESLGEDLARIGDLDGDGLDDWLLGAPGGIRPGTISQTGSVVACSSATGERLFEVCGEQADNRFGESVVAAGDLDFDGVPDFLTASHRERNAAGEEVGAVYAVSGRDGRWLLHLEGQADREYYGEAIASVGDLDRDGAREILVGARFANVSGYGSGRFELRSGATGALIYGEGGSAPNEGLGFAVCAPGDLNGDGTEDFVVSGTGLSPTFPNQNGFVRAYHGRTLRPLWEFSLPVHSVGKALARLQDLDGDGADELLVLGYSGTQYRNLVFTVSGRTGLMLQAITGPPFLLSQELADLGDLDGDGWPEFAVGCVSLCPPGGNYDGGALVYSTRDGRCYSFLPGQQRQGFTGMAVAKAGDLDGDGRSEVLLGSPGWISAGMSRAGKVEILGIPRTPRPFLAVIGGWAGDRTEVLCMPATGDRVVVYFSLGGAGGATRPLPSGLELDLLPPIRALGVLVPDPQDVASAVTILPHFLKGLTLQLQAVMDSPAGPVRTEALSFVVG